MNREQTLTLLRSRSALTSQPYGEDAIDTWHEVLHEWPYTQCRDALIRAAREHPKVTVAHIVAQLPPPRPHITPPVDIDDRERISIDEHLARHRHPTHPDEHLNRAQRLRRIP